MNDMDWDEIEERLKPLREKSDVGLWIDRILSEAYRMGWSDGRRKLYNASAAIVAVVDDDMGKRNADGV